MRDQDGDRGKYRSKYKGRDEEERLQRLLEKRQMPYSEESEASILGGIILRNEVLALLQSLEVQDFFHPKHRVVFAAIRNLEAQRSPIDPVTLEAEIEKCGKLDAIGGITFIGELVLRVPTADNVESYAAIVIEKRITRDTIIMLNDMMEEAYTGLSVGEQLVHDVASSLMKIRTAKETPIATIGDLARVEAGRVMQDLEDRAAGKAVYAGIITGFTAIDERCGGHPIGVMTMYIARPATGKTTFAMACSKSATEAGQLSAIASYEDGGQSFGQRALGQESGLSTERIRARKIGGREEVKALSMGLARAQKRDELFFDCAGMQVEQLVRRVRRENLRRQMEGKSPIRQLVVDYIQKIPMPEWARSRDEGVGHISRVLSTFASTDQLAVVAMSQLNRESEKRDDHRPRLSDIRDSGSLEQDGKLIMGIYYPYQYEPTKHDQSEVYLLMLKNAQGEALQEIPLYWDRATHAIYNSAMDYQAARASRGR